MKKHLSPIEQLIELFTNDADKARKEYVETKSMHALRHLSMLEDVVYQLEQKLPYEQQYHKKTVK